MSEQELKEASVAYRVDPAWEEIDAMIDESYRREVLQARQMSPDDKLILGERLFRWACEVTLAGIRHQNPGFTEAECQRTLRERLVLQKRLEEAA